MQSSCTIGGNARSPGALHRARLQSSPAPLPGRLASLACPGQQQLQQRGCRAPLRCRAEQQPVGGGAEQQVAAPPAQLPELVGEDAAVFNLEDQSLRSWGMFTALLAGVSALLYPASWAFAVRAWFTQQLITQAVVRECTCRQTTQHFSCSPPPSSLHLQVWIAPGLGLGDDFVATLSSISSDSSVVMLAILLVFAIAHSGLAFLRPYGAPGVTACGERLPPVPCLPAARFLLPLRLQMQQPGPPSTACALRPHLVSSSAQLTVPQNAASQPRRGGADWGACLPRHVCAGQPAAGHRGRGLLHRPPLRRRAAVERQVRRGAHRRLHACGRAWLPL